MINRIVTFGIFSTLFFSSYVLFKRPFEFYASYLVIVILLPFFMMKYQFPSSLMKFFFPLLIFGVMDVLLGNNTWPMFIKIFLNIIVSGLFYYYVLCEYEFDIHLLMKYYMIGAYWVSLLGIIQLVSFRIGFVTGYNYQWILNKWSLSVGTLGVRVNSIFSEAAYFGGSIGPAFFISTYCLIFRRKLFLNNLQYIIIILSYCATTATVAYVGILCTLILFLIQWGIVRNLVIFLPLFIFAYMFLYGNLPEFHQRVDGLVLLYSGETADPFKVNGSSFANYNGFHVAFENFKEHPLFGTGLGSHSIAHSRFSLVGPDSIFYLLNQQDANSMFLRLMSETGLYGIILILLFINKCFVIRTPNNSNELYWVTSSACLIIILLQLFRQGNYTYNGFVFFMWMYYFISVKNKEMKLSEENKTLASPVPS